MSHRSPSPPNPQTLLNPQTSPFPLHHGELSPWQALSRDLPWRVLTMSSLRHSLSSRVDLLSAKHLRLDLALHLRLYWDRHFHRCLSMNIYLYMKATFESFVVIRDDIATSQVKLFEDHLQDLERNLPLDDMYKSESVVAAPISVIQLLYNAGGSKGSCKADCITLEKEAGSNIWKLVAARGKSISNMRVWERMEECWRSPHN